jgi:glycosyltransferase involved in cell wall biosynthesis
VPLKVLHVTEAWNAGVGVLVDNLVRRQARDPRIESIHLACSASRTPASLDYSELGRVSVHRYESSRRPWELMQTLVSIRRIVEQVEPDLVHAHSTFPGVYCRLLPIGRPVLYCAHGWSFAQEIHPLKKAVFGATEAALAKLTSGIVHVSRSELRHAYRFLVHSPVSHVVHPGVRGPLLSGSPALEVDPQKLNLAFIGRFDRQKGLDLLLGCANALARDDLHFYLLGDFDRESPKRRASFSNARITELGWIDQAQIDDYLQQMDAIVVPSRWEAFGLVAAEAMRNGKPAIVSDRGGLPEQIIHGYNGLVFCPEDPAGLLRVLEGLDKAELAEMGENARRVWERCFTEDRAYAALMGIYAELTRGAEQPAASRPGRKGASLGLRAAAPPV